MHHTPVVELKSSVSGETAVIDILDRGRGLPIEDEKRIFEAFFRAADLAEGAVPGIGIGSGSLPWSGAS